MAQSLSKEMKKLERQKKSQLLIRFARQKTKVNYYWQSKDEKFEKKNSRSKRNGKTYKAKATSRDEKKKIIFK